MLELLKQSWATVQEELRQRAGEGPYGSWLAELRPVLMERGIVYLEARSRLVLDRVRALYRPLLQEVLSGEIGVPVTVELQTAPEALPIEQLEVSPRHPVVDDGNKTAWLVLQNLAAGRPLPATLFLFHGPAGVGKTFLLRAFAEQVRPTPLRFELLQLLKAFQACHLEGRVAGLHEELVVDRALWIDELHRIAGKEKLQAFLLGVLRVRETLRAPTLLASRWHPKEIRDLDPSLATTLLSGFVTQIEPPGPLGRLRYLRALEGAPSRNGRAHVIEALAQQATGTFAELRSAWARSRDGQLPRKYLELIDPTRTFQRLRDRVCERMGITVAELLGKDQTRKISLARKVLAFLCVQQGLSRAEVGRFLEQRSRAAVSYLTRSFEKQMARSPELRTLIEGML